MNELNNQLWTAVHNKNLVLAEELLSKGADINDKDAKGKSMIRIYASDPSYNKVSEWLLSKGADINSQDDYGDTALHDIIKLKNLKSFDWIISKNIDVNIQNDQGATPLMYACTAGRLDVVEDLIKLGADPNLTSKWGSSPLFTAVSRANLDIVTLLLNEGADPGFIDKDGKTILHEAVFLDRDETFTVNMQKIIELLINDYSSKIDFNKKSRFGLSPLINVRDYPHLMINMIELGADSDVVFHSYNQLTPLHIAFMKKDKDLLKTILNNGYDFDKKDEKGFSPIFYLLNDYTNDIKNMNSIKSSMQNKEIIPGMSINEDLGQDIEVKEQELKNNLFEILEYCISKGLDLKSPISDKTGFHYLHLPIINNDLEMAEKLIKLGAPIETPSVKHKKISEYNHKVDSDINIFKQEIAGIFPPPLLYATNHMNKDMVSLFIDNGADINVHSFEGNNALTYLMNTAAEHNIKTAKAIFMKTGMMDEEQILSQERELKSNLLNDKISILDKLIDNGININKENDNNITPLMFAAKQNEIDFAGILIKRSNVDILYENENGDNALSIALTSGNSLLFREMVNIIKDQGRFEETENVVTQAILTYPEDFNQKNKFLKSLASVAHESLWLNNKKEAIPLIAAIDNDAQDIVKILIESGANVNIQDQDGNTPLIYAVINEDKQSVLLLRSAGADVNMQNDKGLSPLSLSRMSEYAAVRTSMTADSPNILEEKSLSFNLDPSLSIEEVWDNIPSKNKPKPSF